MIMNKGNK